MNKLILYLQDNPKVNKAIYFMSVVFIGCFSFPLEKLNSHLTFWKAYVLIIGYFAIAVGLINIYGKNKEGLVYITSLILTGLGMIGRYILEYGEVSNTRDFTKFNIVLFIVVVPIYITIAYRFSPKIIDRIS